MDEVAFVDGAQARQDLSADLDDLSSRQAPALVHDGSQRAIPVEELHDDEVVTVIAARVVDVHEAGVRDRCGRPCLAEEAIDERRIVDVRRREDLDGHVPVEPLVTRPVDARHAAASDQRVDPIALGQRSPEQRISSAHGAAESRMLAIAARVSVAAARTPASRSSGTAATAPPPSLMAICNARSAVAASVLSAANSSAARSASSASPCSVAVMIRSTAPIIASVVSSHTGSVTRPTSQSAMTV